MLQVFSSFVIAVILFAFVRQMKAALELKVEIYNLIFIKKKYLKLNLTVTDGSFQLVEDVIMKGIGAAIFLQRRVKTGSDAGTDLSQ